ncbi:MAG: serine hydroxymethyltransferase [Bacilli bacterium]|nr:serine hydroxymethyltransferase [Bacilli bacterium]
MHSRFPLIPDITLSQKDPLLSDLLKKEEARQQSKLSLIPSENHVSQAVLAATGSILTNKYSEGYPGKRYYEGQQIIDQIEQLAINRAKDIFSVEHANVQPYSGSPANLAIYAAFLEPGDTVMGMSLPMGGHLTHGWQVSVTGSWFRSVQYGVNKVTGRIDYDEVRAMAKKERPKLLFCGGTAIPRLIDFAAFADIAKEVDALLAADIAHIAGLIAGGVHPSPTGYAPIISTTTHKTLRGPRGAIVMSTRELSQNLDRAVFPGLQGGPHNHTTAGIAVCLHEASQPEFKLYAQQVVKNAQVLAEELTERGYELISGGTDNHLILIDLTSKGIIGKKAAQALDQAGIVTNYNTIPFDPRKPFSPSGLRIGTPAVTSRGMGEQEMRRLASFIDGAIEAAKRESALDLKSIANEISNLAIQFPAPGTC